MNHVPFHLRELPFGARLGLSFLLLTVLGGLVASGAHLVLHHEGRDELPGLSLADLEGVYHGVNTVSPLVSALERGHPDDLPDSDREALLTWLAGERISDDFDNIELGSAAPAEVLDRRCLSCHARSSQHAVGKRIPLEFWDDVRSLAFSREVRPVVTEIMVASMHTHALGMGTLSLLLALMALCTRWPTRLTGILISASGLALFSDLGSWLLAKDTAAFVYVIAASGSIWMTASFALALLTLADLWMRHTKGTAG